MKLFKYLDKNRAPRANEAFLKVKEAQRILTDSDQRSEYDFDIYDETDDETDANDNSYEYDEKQSQYYYSFVKGKKWWETEVIHSYKIDFYFVFT